MQYRTERKRNAEEAVYPRASRPTAAKPNVRRAEHVEASAVGTKLRVLTRGDLSASASGNGER